MKKLLLILLVLMLAACGPASDEPDTSAAGDTDSHEPAAVESTEETPAPAAEEAETASDDAPAAEAEVAEVPAVAPQDAAVVRESDHFLGASDPLVTIIEYGDFQ